MPALRLLSGLPRSMRDVPRLQIVWNVSGLCGGSYPRIQTDQDQGRVHIHHQSTCRGRRHDAELSDGLEQAIAPHGHRSAIHRKKHSGLVGRSSLGASVRLLLKPDGTINKVKLSEPDANGIRWGEGA